MHIETLDSGAALARRAADLVGAARGAVALPSGKTPVATYAELARRARAGELDLGDITAFALDELAGVPGDHPATNRAYFARHFPPPIDVFDGGAADPVAECRRVEAAIAAAGGLELAVLGIGANGHIAFNEPGSPLDSRARLVELAPSTRRGYAGAFGSLEATPRRGLTLGVADLLMARRVILLATGAPKAAIVARALEGPVTTEVPASALQRHADLTVLVDRAAAVRLRTA